MADPTTVNVALAIPSRGSDVGVWDTPVNEDFSAIDGFLGGVQTISVAGSNITLTAPSGSITPSGGPTQSQNAMLMFTGTLTAEVIVTLPLPGYMIIGNFTAPGAFRLRFAAPGAGQVIAVDQGSVQKIVNNGTDVRFVDLPPVGSYLDIADATIPGWITACTVPPYLLCDGSTFSATTYPYLNAKLSGTTLPDFRGRSSYYLNNGTARLTSAGAGIDGNTRFASGGNNGVNLSASQIPSLTSSSGGFTINFFGSVPRYTTPSVAFLNNTGLPGGVWDQSGSGGVSFFTSIPSGGFSVTYSNGSQSIVQSTTPGVVSGLRLIRAA